MINAHLDGAQARLWPIRAMQEYPYHQPSTFAQCGHLLERGEREEIASQDRKEQSRGIPAHLVSCGDNLDCLNDVTELVWLPDGGLGAADKGISIFDIFGVVVERAASSKCDAYMQTASAPGFHFSGDQGFDIHGSSPFDCLDIGPMALSVKGDF